jgi:sugar lactone lactonase YvrE
MAQATVQLPGMTKVITADVAVAAQCELAEGPVWDPDHGLLRWVDVLAGDLHSYDPATGVRDSFATHHPVGAIGLTTSGGLVLAAVDGFALLDDSGLTRVPGFAVDRSVVRFNDGKPDPWGNFCAGTMPWVDGRPGGALYRLRPDGQVSTLIPDVGLSNGLDWTDDRRTFYFADSDSGGVDSFDTDPDTGALGSRRRWVTIPEGDGIPDGLTLDAEGCLWLAVWGSGEVRRYSPDGRLDTVVRLPVTQATCPVFGADGVLYITSAWEGLTPGQRARQPHAGDIFACVPGVPGRPANRFATGTH